MATVPLQQTPTVDLDVGQAPLFSATNIEPVRDTGVADDIQRVGNAEKQLAQIAIKNKQEQDDVISNDAYNGYQEEADAKVNEYLETRLGAAIATVDYDKESNKPITAYDKLIKDLDEISNKYLDTLTNGDQKQIFNDKYSASKRLSKNKAVKHSLNQRRLHLDEQTKSNINMAKKGAIDSFESWDDDEGDYNINYYRGIAEIKRRAELNDRNTDINKGPLSAKYVEEIQLYNKEIMEGVVDQLRKLPGGHTIADNYVKKQKPKELKEIVTELEQSIAEKHEDYNIEKCVDAALSNNSNQNTGDFLDQTKKLLCLKSNHFVNDGTGASVYDGNHSDKINIAGQTQENNIDTLEKIRNESKFYKLDSDATLLPEHQTTHLFAIQHLGVNKADSLYSKAKSNLNIDAEQYKNNPIYAENINKKIIDNYNNLIVEEADKQYRPKINSLTNKIKKLQNTPNISTPTIGSLGAIPGSKAAKAETTDVKNKSTLKKLKKELATAEANDSGFVETLANDLQIIKRGIQYDGTFTNNTDFVTGLRPLSELKDELRTTISDPKQLNYALKDLDIKYNKIKNESTEIYNGVLNNAKEIAFAEPGGWKNLEINGIDIDNFKKKDQEILKKGQPKESNKNTLIKLKQNPIEIKNNLPSYSHELSQSDYLSLVNYSKSLNSDDDVIAASIDNDLLEFVLKKKGFDDIRNKVDDNAKDDYLELEVEWKNRIDQEQKNLGKKIGREKKQQILENILNDIVFTGQKTGRFLGIFGGENKGVPLSTVDDDQLVKAFVEINGKTIKLNSINSYQRKKIIKTLQSKGQLVTAEAIAQLWVLAGRPTVDNDFDMQTYVNSRQQ
mgnify:CR=1 FL=1